MSEKNPIVTMKRHSKRPDGSNLTSVINETSILGSPWVPIYETEVEFSSKHFESAMSNIIKQPNVNSTVILRADILRENIYDPDKGNTMFTSKDIDKFPEFPGAGETNENGEIEPILYRHFDDTQLRGIPLSNSRVEFKPKCEIVRRIIPRNPFKDYIINQTSLIMTGDDDSIMVVYVPHIKSSEETPFYLPPVYAIAIVYHKTKLSINYLPFDYETKNHETLEKELRQLDARDRSIRIAMRLLQTSLKHSQGTKDGYEKRVIHDVVVPKESFQNRYISLKKKYSSKLVNTWCEKTDPKKHVFEDLAIAAFLIELWKLKYGDNKESFQFVDVGCGNGLLVYVLHLEGYKGKGIDARARKSWQTYPQTTQDNLLVKIIIPEILLQSKQYFEIPDPNDPSLMTYHASSKLQEYDHVSTTEEFKTENINTFIIGNHSDELTCWIPLLGYPFLVIPCCSHALSGAKKRFTSKKPPINSTKTGNHPPENPAKNQLSTYGALVDHVEQISKQMGWIVEKELLRIPSTRNMALMAFDMHSKFKDDTPQDFQARVASVLAREGGADAWVVNAMKLMTKPPRDH